MSNRSFSTDFGCAVSNGAFTRISGGGQRFGTPDYYFEALASAHEVQEMLLHTEPSATVIPIEKFSVDRVLGAGSLLVEVKTARDGGAVLLDPRAISALSKCPRTGDTRFLVSGRHAVAIPALDFSAFARAVDIYRLKSASRDSRPVHSKGGAYANHLTCDWRGPPPRPGLTPQACEWRGFVYD